MGIVVDVKEYESVSKKTYEYVEAVFGNDGRFLGYVVQKDGKYGFANINYKETCECQFTQEEMEEYLMRILKVG